jgi:hypothetical protein
MLYFLLEQHVFCSKSCSGINGPPKQYWSKLLLALSTLAVRISSNRLERYLNSTRSLLNVYCAS